MEKVTFTKNELAFLSMVINYEDRESQKQDNYSNAGVAEAALLFDGNRNAAGGLVTSLVNKDIGAIDMTMTGNNGEVIDLFWLNEDAIDTVYDALGLE